MGLIPVFLKPSAKQLFPPGTILRALGYTHALYVEPDGSGYFHDTPSWDGLPWAAIKLATDSHVMFLKAVECGWYKTYSGVVLWKGKTYAVSLEDFDAIES